MEPFDNLKLTPLPHCQGSDGPCENVEAEWFHTTTAYSDEARNWAYMCKECKEVVLDCWREMWDTYYS